MNKIVTWFKALSSNAKLLVVGGAVVGSSFVVNAVGASDPGTPIPPPAPPAVTVTEEVVEVVEPVAFTTRTQDDGNLAAGTTKTGQEGVPGEKKVAYKVVYANGVQTSRVKAGEVVTRAPVDKIVLNGIYVAPPPRNSGVEAIDSDCDPNYDPCVPDVSYDLDCGDIGFEVEVVGSDPHRFDRDGDGYGCESY